MRYSYTKALNTITDWAIKEGYEDISFDHDDISYIDWQSDSLNSPNIIRIQGKNPIEIKVYLLLHELGHHQLRKNWDKFKKMLPVTAYAEHVHFIKNEGKYKRRVTYNVSCMEEEFKAWEEGYKLGEKLGVKINLDKWNALKSKCLISYMRYYATKK